MNAERGLQSRLFPAPAGMNRSPVGRGPSSGSIPASAEMNRQRTVSSACVERVPRACAGHRFRVGFTGPLGACRCVICTSSRALRRGRGHR